MTSPAFLFFLIFFQNSDFSGVSKFINKCRKEILRCAPPASPMCDFLIFFYFYLAFDKAYQWFKSKHAGCKKKLQLSPSRQQLNWGIVSKYYVAICCNSLYGEVFQSISFMHRDNSIHRKLFRISIVNMQKFHSPEAVQEFFWSRSQDCFSLLHFTASFEAIFWDSLFFSLIFKQNCI